MHKRALGLVVAVILGVVLVSASGALATTNARTATRTAQTVTNVDVSTRAAVIHYLRSIHVRAKGVVIQRGLRNYAGAHCPGTRWTCAGTRHTVVQIAKRGGLNRFACRTAKCAVVQFGSASRGLKAASRVKPPPPPSYVLCLRTTGVTQSCLINQSNATGLNKAVVWMVTPKLTGLTQSANYSASITQGPLSAGTSDNTNLACVHQFVWLDGSTTKTNTASTTVTNDNHELIKIQQNSLKGSNTVEDAVPSGNTYDCSDGSTMQQDELLTSVVNSKGSITQNEDTLSSTTNCVPAGDTGSGCANVVTQIDQNQDINNFSGFKGHASGLNTANVEQSAYQVAIANTPNGTVTQQQDASVPAIPYSGLVGTLNQDSSKTSTASATQTETQCEDAVNVPTLQAPTDPNNPPQCPVLNATNDAPPPANVHLNQTQYGPEGIIGTPANQSGQVHANHKGYGESKQTGNPDCLLHHPTDCDSFHLHQTSTQSTDAHGSQTNTIQGDCSSEGGSCQADQTANLNNGTTQAGWTAPAIPDVHINCQPSQSCSATPPPAPQFVSGPTSPNLSSSAAFTFTDTATGIQFLCAIDGNTTTPVTCSSDTAFFQGYGAHTFQVAASDGHGHVSAYVPTSAFTWTNVPPTPSIDIGPPSTSNSSSATFTFTDADATLTLECQIDNSGYSTCTSPWTYSNLADGSHTFSVKATDGTHESAVASLTWTISGGGATANPVDSLNPSTDPSGACLDSYASGSGFNGTPLKVNETADLNAYDGQPIELRFSFSTGDALYNAFEGWYLNNIHVTGTSGSVFSDAVAAGDSNFTALGDHGIAPGWHVTNSNATMGTAWWYGNDATGTYQTPGSADTCNDITPNQGTITTRVFTLGTNSQLSFDTLWQIEGVNSSTFDQMNVQVIPVTSAAG